METNETLKRVRSIVLQVFRSKVKSTNRHSILASSDMIQVWSRLDGYDGVELALSLEEEFLKEEIEVDDSWILYPCAKPLLRKWNSDFSTVDDYCRYLSTKIDDQSANSSE